MNNTTTGKIYHLNIQDIDYRGRTAEHAVSVCLQGLHVRYRLRQRSHGGLVVAARYLGGMAEVEVKTCDGRCRSRTEDLRAPFDADLDINGKPEDLWSGHLREQVEKLGCAPEPLVREYLRRGFGDGDSDEAYYCSGHYHVRRVCTEYGMGSDYAVVGYCDRCACRLQRLRLPSHVARAVAARLNLVTAPPA